MSQEVRRLLVAYDVSDDVRRGRVAHILSAFGDRLQYSVFVVDGRRPQFVRLRRRLIDAIDQERDSLLLCDLGPRRTVVPPVFEQIGVSAPFFGDVPPVM